jgi:hypothetical protein
MMTADKARQAFAALIAQAIPDDQAQVMGNWEPIQWEIFIKLTVMVLPKVFESEGLNQADLDNFNKTVLGALEASKQKPLTEVEMYRKVVGAGGDVPWQIRFIDDMRAIGVLVDYCDGCGRPDCDGCPCGSTTSVNHKALTPEVSEKLRQIFLERDKKA